MENVRPRRFAGLTGMVVATDRDEISVRFGSPSSHSSSIAFRRREIAAVEVGETLLETRQAPAIPVSGSSVDARPR